MDLRVPHSWLKDYCDTPLTPTDLAARVSLSGPSIDRLEQEEGEWMYTAEITTNRPDAYSIVGFAREVAAIVDGVYHEIFSPKLRDATQKTIPRAKKLMPLSVVIDEPKLCRRYMGAVLTNIEIKLSPEWMQKRLLLSGLRPINNVVDITNYVMLEYGQPTHAFDAELLARSGDRCEIRVRKARKDESFVTLDGVEKKLNPSILVIADTEKVLALAGIKGGHSAGISEATTTIVLESASFDPLSVRKTSRVLDLRTDSSARYEKNLSPEYCSYVIIRTLDLLCRYAGAVLSSEIIDTYPSPEPPNTLVFDPTHVERILGVSLSVKEIKSILTRLGFSLKKSDGGLVGMDVPFWRAADIEGDGSVDIVEEIARIHGYEKLPTEPLRGALPCIPRDATFFWERETKHFLKSLGWTECMTYSFLSEKTLQLAGYCSRDAVKIHNPLSAEFEYLRPSLVPSMLSVLAANEQKAEAIRLFELSTCYRPMGESQLPKEKLSLVGAHLSRKPDWELFSMVKGTVDAVLKEWLGDGANISYLPWSGEGALQKGESARIFIGECELGSVGILAKQLSLSFGLKTSVALFELDFSETVPLMTRAKRYLSIPKYPSVERDVAIVLQKKYAYAEIMHAFLAYKPLLVEARLFDVFEHSKLGADRQSLAFHLSYQSTERTLTAEEVDAVHAKVLAMLQKKFGAEIR